MSTKNNTKKASVEEIDVRISAANPSQQTVLKRIDELKSRLVHSEREDHVREVQEWERKAHRALLTLDLEANAGVKILIKEITRMVRETNELLVIAPSKDLSDAQRDGLIEKRDFMLWFLGFFGQAKQDVASLEKELEYQLESGVGGDIESDDEY